MNNRFDLLPTRDRRGRISFQRATTNEELIRQAVNHWGHLTLRVSFSVRDADGQYKGLKGRSITIKKVKDGAVMEKVVGKIEEVLQR